jgi:hypothetical protein
MKKLILFFFILAALVEFKIYLSSTESAIERPDKKNALQMWNGGKPSLPIQINMIENQLRIATGSPCEKIKVKISGTDGLNIKDNIDDELDCDFEKEKNYNLELDKNFAGTGYVVVEVQLVTDDEAKSTTKAFAFSGNLKNDIKSKSVPAVKDQYGVLYHEFPSSSRH